MGDFNFDHSWKTEERNIDPLYKDVFRTLNPGVEAFTMPAYGQFPPWMPDRILVHKDAEFKMKEIYIIGRFCIPSFTG